MKFIDFSEESLATGLINLTFADNFKSDIVTIQDVGAGADFALSHNLKKTPQYRIILRQEGGEYITDLYTKEWNDKTIYLKNNGATALKRLVVLIM